MADGVLKKGVDSGALTKYPLLSPLSWDSGRKSAQGQVWKIGVDSWALTIASHSAVLVVVTVSSDMEQEFGSVICQGPRSVGLTRTTPERSFGVLLSSSPTPAIGALVTGLNASAVAMLPA